MLLILLHSQVGAAQAICLDSRLCQAWIINSNYFLINDSTSGSVELKVLGHKFKVSCYWINTNPLDHVSMNNFTSSKIITVCWPLKNAVLCWQQIFIYDWSTNYWMKHTRCSGVTVAAFSCTCSTLSIGSTTVRLVAIWRQCVYFAVIFWVMSNSPESQPLGKKDYFVGSAKGPRRLAQPSLICYRAILPPCQERCQAKDKECECDCVCAWGTERVNLLKTSYLVLVSEDTVSLMK